MGGLYKTEAPGRILESCQGENHCFKTITSSGMGTNSTVIRWCCACGCIRLLNGDKIVLSDVPTLFTLLVQARKSP